MIPFLIAPAYVRHDLLLRMLESVDVPVERGLLVDNGLNLPAAPEYHDVMRAATRLHLRVLRPPFASIGYGGAINFGILQAPDAPWWLWASSDIAFGPGDLAAIAAGMEAATGPRVITGSRDDSRMLRFTYGALNRAAVAAIGLVDEGFFPVYYDDDDYEWRATVAGVEWLTHDGRIAHGETGAVGSTTIRSDPAAARRNGATFAANRARYVAKWGGPPGAEAFTTPWDGGHPVWYTGPVDPAARARQAW